MTFKDQVEEAVMTHAELAWAIDNWEQFGAPVGPEGSFSFGVHRTMRAIVDYLRPVIITDEIRDRLAPAIADTYLDFRYGGRVLERTDVPGEDLLFMEMHSPVTDYANGDLERLAAAARKRGRIVSDEAEAAAVATMRAASYNPIAVSNATDGLQLFDCTNASSRDGRTAWTIFGMYTHIDEDLIREELADVPGELAKMQRHKRLYRSFGVEPEFQINTVEEYVEWATEDLANRTALVLAQLQVYGDFMMQKLPPSLARLDRSARRRIERKDLEIPEPGTVSVIHLRQVDSTGREVNRDGSGGKLLYRHPRRGHWCHVKETGTVYWRREHLVGPDGAPIVYRNRVLAVSR